jgi:hypothetical protein
VILLGFKTEFKEELYVLTIANRSIVNKESGLVCYKTKLLFIAVGKSYIKEIRLDVVALGNYQVILGML